MASPPKKIILEIARPARPIPEMIDKLWARKIPAIIVLDMERDGWQLQDAAKWIRDFRLEYQRRSLQAKTHKTGGVLHMIQRENAPADVPSVFVLKDTIAPMESRILTQAGASIYDRSLEANKHLQTPEQLAAHFSGLPDPVAFLVNQMRMN